MPHHMTTQTNHAQEVAFWRLSQEHAFKAQARPANWGCLQKHKQPAILSTVLTWAF